jgi:hypothetical protein
MLGHGEKLAWFGARPSEPVFVLPWPNGSPTRAACSGADLGRLLHLSRRLPGEADLKESRPVVEVRTPDLTIALSTDECWRLYVLLGDRAPFVRNRLSTIRHGGAGPVSLATQEERAQVLDALQAGEGDPLSQGLSSLRTALGVTAIS